MITSTKICKHCNKSKDQKYYRKERNDCRLCEKEKEKIFRLTKHGVLGTIYNNQKSNSKTRNHVAPSYSLQDLKAWIDNNDKFHKLYLKWKENGYNTNDKPSIDRKEDDKPYTLNNIQIMTWKENKKKGHLYHKLGIIDYDLKPVSQFDTNGTFLKTYISISQAARDLNLFGTNISNACKGIYHTCGGFKWRYINANTKA